MHIQEAWVRPGPHGMGSPELASGGKGLRKRAGKERLYMGLYYGENSKGFSTRFFISLSPLCSCSFCATKLRPSVSHSVMGTVSLYDSQVLNLGEKKTQNLHGSFNPHGN